MTKRHRELLTVGLIILVTLACTISLGEPQAQAVVIPTLSQQDQIKTSVAQTIAANQPPAPVQPPVVATTQAPPAPPPPAGPPTPTSPPPNWAKLVWENYPDGSDLNINANFTKTWRLLNAGTSTWNTNYKAIFYSGTSMNGPGTKNFTQIVHPGETMDFSMALKAPASPGSYKGTWHLYADDNSDFTTYGIWAAIDAINPAPPAPAFAVTSAFTTVDNVMGPFQCPHTFHFTANITTNGPGTVIYRWVRSVPSLAVNQTLVYAAAGTKTVTTSWSLASGTPSMKIYIVEPNHQYFNAVSIHCP
jgi:hypothetical protein